MCLSWKLYRYYSILYTIDTNVNICIKFSITKRTRLLNYVIPDDGQCIIDNPDNNKWDHAKCKQPPYDCYDGLIHVGVCQGGAPIIMSAPHFYNGDPELLEHFDPPLAPNKDLHDTILDLEPITSIALNAHKRIQVKTLLIVIN